MSDTQPLDSTARKPIRLWPGAAAVILMWTAWLVVPAVFPDLGPYPLFAALGLALAVVLWWLFFSRAPWLERIGALILIVAGIAATSRLVHESISNGMMGMMLFVYAIPVMSLALVAGVAIGRRFPAGARRATLAASILLACVAFTLIRTGGVRGEGGSDLHWRWTPTPEERLLAQGGDIPLAGNAGEAGSLANREPAADAEPAVPAPPAVAEEKPGPALPETGAQRPARSDPAPVRAGSIPVPSDPEIPRADEPPASEPTPGRAEWPGFRGPDRDGVVRGVRIETDWSKSPPVELWRRPIGPGWSSFAVNGDLVYTQEQRGEHEVVSCYRLSTGEPVWVHADQTRFWESNAGAGPRGTPTLHGGRAYTFGATGIVNALDAESGRRIWTRNAAADAGKEIPGWGFASSPLATGDLVIVAAAGRLVAYDAATGNPRWFGEAGGGGYSSPHLASIDGVPQVLLLRGARTISVAPADGSALWEHEWSGTSILQPALAAGGDVLIAGGDMMGGVGIRRLGVAHGARGWTVEERWTTRGLKPYFNDFVVHEGHAYGFDGSILAAIDLADGRRVWKGGRYGNGQLVLLREQGVLLVLSEDGELALVRAAPDRFTELAKMPALDGKTWNHPVLVGDVLLVRNGEEMAAFRLSGADR